MISSIEIGFLSARSFMVSRKSSSLPLISSFIFLYINFFSSGVNVSMSSKTFWTLFAIRQRHLSLHINSIPQFDIRRSINLTRRNGSRWSPFRTRRNSSLPLTVVPRVLEPFFSSMLGTIPPDQSELCRLRLAKFKEHMRFEIAALIRPNPYQGGYFKPHVLLELSKAQPTQFRLVRRDCAEHRRKERFQDPGHNGERCLLYTSDAADEEDSVDLGGRR